MPRLTIEQLGERVDNGFNRIDRSIKSLADNQLNYPRTDIMDLRFQEVEAKLLELSNKDKELEIQIQKAIGKSKLQIWLTGTLSAALGSILTFLIIYFLNNVGG